MAKQSEAVADGAPSAVPRLIRADLAKALRSQKLRKGQQLRVVITHRSRSWRLEVFNPERAPEEK